SHHTHDRCVCQIGTVRIVMHSVFRMAREHIMERDVAGRIERWSGCMDVALDHRDANCACRESVTTPRSCTKQSGSCWIAGSYTPCTGLKHLILQGFFQRCSIGHDPRVRPVKTTCYAKLGQLRPWNPI